MKAIAIHSYKGGTGKTCIAVNLAATYAARGKNVCLLDLDFGAPSLHTIFESETKYYTNDLLDDRCAIKHVLIDFKERFGTEGHFYVGFSNPHADAIRDIISKDRKWQVKALRRLIQAKKELAEMKIDICIFDTSPGIGYASVNAIAAADYALLVLKPDICDIEGTKQMIYGVYTLIHRESGIIINKLIAGLDDSKIKSEINRLFEIPVIESIACFCEISNRGAKEIFALTQTEHPFAKAISRISEKIS